MLQNGWVLESDFLQNEPRNRVYMGLEASHFIGEISTGIIKRWCNMVQHIFLETTQNTKGVNNLEQPETRIKSRWNYNRTPPLSQPHDWNQTISETNKP